jgi:hypothetical protein
VKRKQKDVQPL